MSDPPIHNVFVVINPASGQDRPILSIMNRAFSAGGVNWDVGLTKRSGDALRMAREAVLAGADAVAVYGGDGTLNEVASGLSGSGVPLAIFPGGTANVMSIELGIPGDLEQAIGLVCNHTHQIRTIDMGRVHGSLASDQMFLLRLSVGYFARMTEGTARESKNRMGVLAYAFSALSALPQAEMVHFQIEIDGDLVEAEGVTCVIANSGAMGMPGLTFSRQVSVDDGLLDVVVMRNADLLEVAKVLGNALGGVENLPHWQGRQITLHADPPQPIECDGEMIEATPVMVSIVPQALRVIVPGSMTVEALTQEILNQE
ncbi:MAG: diacylglycerol kinase family protein [Chloroflexota bacterium]